MTMRLSRTALALPLLAASLVTGCAGNDQVGAASGSPSAAGPSDIAPSVSSQGKKAGDQQFPDVLKVELSGSKGTFTLDVTMSSPYDSPDRYADGWRVLDPDGKELGAHMLTHDHASEQPFTREQTGLDIPEGVQTITVEGRDQVSGYGGKTVEVDVPQ